MYSSTLWLTPFLLGTKIMQAGQTAARICASWPAPLGSRFTERPSSRAMASTLATSAASKATGSKRASDRRAKPTPSARAVSSAKVRTRRSASWSRASSVLRRSTVMTTRFGTTFTRFGATFSMPTVATWWPPSSFASLRAKTAISAAT